MANKKAVLGRPLPDASLPRNAFDRSFNRSFHYSVGMAIPAFGAVPVWAGSHSKINRKIFQRLDDVYTAAFTPLDTHVQLYFVPFRQLQTEWDDMKLNIQDYNSSMFCDPNNPLNPITNRSKAPWCMLSEIKAMLEDEEISGLDSLGYPFVPGALRLLNFFGYGNYLSPSEITDDCEVNLLRFCAYQKVYFDHFRNTAYESNNPIYYNMDYYRNAGYHVTDKNVLKGLLTLRYINYRKDYFQNLYPALTYVVSNPNGRNWMIPSWVQGSNYNSSDSVYGSFTGQTGNDEGRWIGSDGNPMSGTVPLYTGSDGRSVKTVDPAITVRHNHAFGGIASFDPNDIIAVMNPQTIRAEFALDKLLRASAYAPKHAKDQYEARYGIKFKYNPNESIFIGSFMNDIVINEVTNMAQTATETTGANLGDIGGKGIGSADYGSTLDFNNMEDGFIIPIVYTLPRTCYSSQRIDTFNLHVDRQDFFIPEFMDLGLRPVTMREYMNVPQNGEQQSVWSNHVLGYQPPYQEYKIGIDENMGLFGRPTEDNEFTRFVVNTNIPNNPDILPIDGASYQFFKVKPQDVRNIFRVAYDGTPYTDQIKSYMRFSIVVNQNMSVHGQPRLGS